MPDAPASSSPAGSGALVRVFAEHQADLLRDWVAAQARVVSAGRVADAELRGQSAEFLQLAAPALAADAASAQGPAWAPVREYLGALSRTRAQQGFSPAETATFVLSLKEAVFAQLREQLGGDGDALAGAIWTATRLLDTLALHTTDAYMRSREEVIRRQQQDLLELSTPVVTLWDGVLALPMIGTLDSARTQVVMETLLQRIVETGADIAIIDITGVPTVDTLTAQHLLKTVTAARLMGAECIISGIRPQIAQTIVHLGVDLGDVTTKASLADAFRLALQRTGRGVTRIAGTGAGTRDAGGERGGAALRR